MKPERAFTIFALSIVCVSGTAQVRPGTEPILSPEVRPDHTVIFRISTLAATKVTLEAHDLTGIGPKVSDMLRFCDEVAPGKFNILGVDHSHWYNDFGFTRKMLANTGHASIVHSYIYFDGVLDRYKYNDAASAHLAAYAVELAYAYQDNLTRPGWVEEIGVSAKECLPADVHGSAGT